LENRNVELGRCRSRWEEGPNIKIEFKEIGFQDADRINLAQDTDG
jgi:hypothetical protein